MFIVGNSESLLESNPDAIPRDYTVGLGTILDKMQPRYLLVVDSKIQKFRIREIRKYRGTILQYSKLPRIKNSQARKVFFDIEAPEHITRKEGSLACSHNSALYAMEIIARAGVPNIYLVACDFYVRQGKKVHYYGDNPKTGSPHNRKSYDRRYRERLPTLRKNHDVLAKWGTKLWNCSPWPGPLDKFIPRKTVADAVRELTANPPKVKLEKGRYTR